MKRMTTFLAVAALCLTAVGCNPQNYGGLRPPAPYRTGPTRNNMAVGAVAGASDSPAHSAVETAKQWQIKYGQRTEECLNLQRKCADLETQNRQLAQKTAELGGELNQAQKELLDANTTLQDLDAELAKWQKDVLGFRDEMRRAQQVELDLLVKMVVLLGGEAPPTERAVPTSSPPAGEPSDKLAATTGAGR